MLSEVIIVGSHLLICLRIGTGVGLGPEFENPDSKRAGAGLAGAADS